jgi:hypothetical protein
MDGCSFGLASTVIPADFAVNLINRILYSIHGYRFDQFIIYISLYFKQYNINNMFKLSLFIIFTMCLYINRKQFYNL